MYVLRHDAAECSTASALRRGKAWSALNVGEDGATTTPFDLLSPGRMRVAADHGWGEGRATGPALGPEASRCSAGYAQLNNYFPDLRWSVPEKGFLSTGSRVPQCSPPAQVRIARPPGRAAPRRVRSRGGGGRPGRQRCPCSCASVEVAAGLVGGCPLGFEVDVSASGWI